MKSAINLFFCMGLYILIVPLSKLNPLLRFNFYRKGLEKHGFLKMSDGRAMLTPKYYNMMRDILSSLNFYSISGFLSVGTVPFWLLVGKLIGDDYLIVFGCLILCFGIPLYITEHFVLKNDIWLVYWKQLFTMSSKKRRKIIIYSCLAKIGIWLLYFTVYIVCIPKINSM